MKRFVSASFVLVSAWGGLAFAACEPGQRVQGPALGNLLAAGTLICGRPAGGYAGSPNDRWQEEHRAGGQLWDYKKGSSDKIDPSKQVGTWTVVQTGGGTVTHSYTGGPSYTWTVHQVSTGVYSFCTASNGSEVVRAFISVGSGPCAGYP